MANWRKKELPLEDWTALQGKFADLQLALGEPRMTMFCKSPLGEAAAEIFITGPHTEKVEAMSPGGWEDSTKPSGEGVALLVGPADSWERFGIES